ncbi:MAG: bifunctional phosphoribosyl-AMP cyclohydrolase/phosphoribosyl-ATP diphosphatase HisIE [Oscillospiraceae bacterium]|jgi:phosphoribosyl-ATP pyrophosphohydrolase/phosphoribosyl-AMP cyclohydrolase|nr:bifunctional phosphoribosyl-AMP cyclohydrolase/phosphoribosyl-ATP diphosphatase HisIE [Oscillospiraceae bacterium]
MNDAAFDKDALLSAVKWDERGLAPVIAREAATGETLMLAYMNREALIQTLDTGRAVYWSRSRRELWVKGETSGNAQRVRAVSLDCDGDALLIHVDQTGNACHTGERSCFYRTLPLPDPSGSVPSGPAILGELFETIRDRDAHPVPGSYTNYLLEKGVEKICKKVGEEASETIIASVKGAPDEVRREAADLIYHLWTLLYNQGLTPEDIYAELAGRHK